jgi:predicted HAD superfamily Cof-like phosphohydrolase
MNNAQRMVKEFMLACQSDQVTQQPQLLTTRLKSLRYALIEEELEEYAKADNIYDVADALGDMLYVVYGAAICHGLDMEPIFEEIHRSNMQKLHGPKRADGKQLKPDGWQPPDIYTQVEMQRAHEYNITAE